MNAIVEVNSYLASSHVIPPGVFMAYKIGTLAKNGLISNKMKSYNRSNDNLCDKKNNNKIDCKNIGNSYSDTNNDDVKI